MGRDSEDRKKKRQRVAAADSEAPTASRLVADEQSKKSPQSNDLVLRAQEPVESVRNSEDQTPPQKGDRVLRPRSVSSKAGNHGQSEGVSTGSPQNATPETAKKFPGDTSPEPGRRVVDTLLSLHHLKDREPNFKPELEPPIDFSGAVKTGVKRQAGSLDDATLQHDTMESLKSYIRQMNGVLEEGWEAEIQRKYGRINKFFISPDKQRFRSRIEVAKHLGIYWQSKQGLGNVGSASHMRSGVGLGLHTHRASESQITPILVESDDTQAGNVTGDAVESDKRTGNPLKGSEDRAFQLNVSPRGQDRRTQTQREESSGQSKKADFSVSARYHGKSSEISKSGKVNKNTKADKEEVTRETDRVRSAKKKPPSAALVTQHCQDVLRDVISAERFGALCSMLHYAPPLGYLENTQQFKAPTSISGSLDLQLVTLRLATGAYGRTPEMFSSDMQQVWKNIRSVGNELVNLANTLSELSDNLYKEQVLSLFPVETEERGGLVNSNGIDPVSGKYSQEQNLILQQRGPGKQSVDCDSPFLDDCRGRKESKVTPLKILPIRGARKVSVLSDIVDATEQVMHQATPNFLGYEQVTPQHQALETSSQELNSPDTKKATHRSGVSRQSNDQVKKSSRLRSPQTFKAVIEERACKKCGLSQGTDCLVCSSCNAGYHTYCLTPTLTSLPESGWCCPTCAPISATEGPCIVSFAQETREISSDAQELSLVPEQSVDQTSEESREPLKITSKGGICKGCGKDDDNVLLCDSCDAAYHMNCLTPAVEGVPDGNWYCPLCVASGKGPLVSHSFHEVGHVDGHHCAVCDRIGGKALVPVEDSLPEHPVVSITEKLCKICGLDKDKKSIISCSACDKQYHLFCLKPPLKKFPNGIWFCPSCLCRSCKVDVDDDMILLCDVCDEGYHTYCLSPPLAEIPEGSWYCPSCAEVQKPPQRAMSPEEERPIVSDSSKMVTEPSKRKRKSSEPRRSI